MLKAFPESSSSLDILFMGDYSEVNPDVVLRTALKEGYDCVLIDSLAEISQIIMLIILVVLVSQILTEFCNCLMSIIWQIMMLRINTTFLVIQQVTKSGTFVGSNKIKHMTTAMGHLKFDSDGQRFFHFSKNRRGGKW